MRLSLYAKAMVHERRRRHDARRSAAISQPGTIAITWLKDFLLAPLRKSERGAAAMEFAFVAPALIGMMIAILQTAIAFLTQQALETVTEATARQVMTGAAQQASMSQSQFTAAACSRLPAYMSCSNLIVDMQTVSAFTNANTSRPTLTFNSGGAVTNSWNYQLGNQGDIVVLRMMYRLNVIGGPLGFNISNLSNGQRLLLATAVFKNEPYL